MNSPVENVESMQIGSVDFVSPNEIKVLLDLGAPNDVALNSGVPRPFPRVNTYVLVPGEGGFLVAQIEWITIEHSQFPKRRGIQDFGILDLPYPLRKMSVIPIGILREGMDEKKNREIYKFSRGIEVFPTVGDPVLLPTQEQLRSIVESGTDRRVHIGVSPIAGNAIVAVDPDKLFGRHLAVLGNTGSGKSCSVAGLIRWSIESAKKNLANKGVPNTHFIILDPNGEYTKSFSDMENVRVFGAEENNKLRIEQLEVPIWLWNTTEWVEFTQASAKAQRPTLVQALRCVRDGSLTTENKPRKRVKQWIKSVIKINQLEMADGIPWAGRGKSKGYSERLRVWEQDLKDYSDQALSKSEHEALALLQAAINAVYMSNVNSEEWPLYPAKSIERFQDGLIRTYTVFGGLVTDILPIDADIPRPFTGEDLLDSIIANAELMNTSEYIETMLVRIKSLLSDAKLNPIIGSGSGSLNDWLNTYICPSNKEKKEPEKKSGSVTIIDLSLLPAEVTHLITSVIARITLEALQRYRRQNDGKVLPIVLVMEEAHTFIKRYNDSVEDTNTAALCTSVFEKIAREGRKYGLGLVLSSQRPSELSPTVISQCNSFLLHRISNDRDQEMVHRLVPDNMRGILRELPLLPSGNAVLLGWASELPVTVKMNYLKEKFRPKSDDPKYWDAWIQEKPLVDWSKISDEWEGAIKKNK
ncbi:hypothetical protein HMPREF9162_0739 [Selenomonas sp. oral taxon 137 str. F0430]|uniref:ATP-binding protein n=1 Tax=Selenomonas sp. oral taxon 137 TaxID=712531 RepID=UPI0001EB2281|nr:DUF87 domain-containing protein [Selenomonas sp. oral taxon 137]EFR41625.1 hypothetical protein HMPREF9162_0739 [Selenomonas sp. oral taxon 137 str. F0430]